MTTCECDVLVGPGRTPRVTFAVEDGTGDPIAIQVRSGAWQPSDALRWLLSVIEPGDRVLDLGGHIGTFAVPAAALGAHVTAVEASPANAALLEAAARATGVQDRLRVIRRAVSDRPGMLEFSDAGPYGTIATARTRSDGWQAVQVEATTIDDLAAGAGAGFRWLKIDIEGAECAALGSGGATLAGLRGLVIESNGFMLSEHGCSAERLLALLAGAGLGVFSVSGTTLSATGMAVQAMTTVDYVATHGVPPLPDGWQIGEPARREALVADLLAELRHPVPQHRAYALAVARRAPAWLRLRPAVRRAVRALAGEDNPYVRRAP